jgi:hypothetical protein
MARGIDTSNYEEVMDDFKTILGDRPMQSEFNSFTRSLYLLIILIKLVVTKSCFANEGRY